MPISAIALSAAWALILFVLRTLILWRRTGLTGMNGFRGRVGSLEWFAGLGASGGIVLSFLAPFASLNGWPLGELLIANAGLHIAGAAIAAIGILAGSLAQLSMGNSWRIGVDQDESTDLVTDGVFQWARNPIFTSMFVYLIGFTLVVPSFFTLITVLMFAVGIHLQVRFVEEPHLHRTHGKAYADYAARVGRFVPAVGLLREP